MGPLTQIERWQPTLSGALDAPLKVAAVDGTATSGSATAQSVKVSVGDSESESPTYARATRRTGEPAIDRMLERDGSDAPAPRTVTYSFYDQGVGVGDPAAQHARSVADRQRIRDALSYYATVANVEFVEVRAGGDVQYGATPAPSPAALRDAAPANDGQAASDDSSASAQPQPADPGADPVTGEQRAPTQVDDLVGLNVADPDGLGGNPTLA